jgi:hypothetical protein
VPVCQDSTCGELESRSYGAPPDLLGVGDREAVGSWPPLSASPRPFGPRHDDLIRRSLGPVSTERRAR